MIMTPFQRQKAVLYCRVSSAKQRIDGHGLASQERRCRDYAAMKGYEVVEVFRDDVSGGHPQRQRDGCEEWHARHRRYRGSGPCQRSS
ncbi:recombinase family protein [Ensifer soli]|uniref:recombinase family protein n=1 Tax=Ciceribacter sp. sgz301302 TaxID=3342379 RepID=UPI0035BB19C3